MITTLASGHASWCKDSLLWQFPCPQDKTEKDNKTYRFLEEEREKWKLYEEGIGWLPT